MPKTAPQKPVRMLRRPEVSERVGLQRTTLYKWISEGRFPKPIELGPRTVAWLESDVDAWITARVDAARAKAA